MRTRTRRLAWGRQSARKEGRWWEWEVCGTDSQVLLEGDGHSSMLGAPLWGRHGGMDRNGDNQSA